MSAAPHASAAAPRGPAWWRVPLLLLGFVALLAGIGAGLARLAFAMPDAITAAAPWHGPLMVCGFFGVVIALERAVALARPWAYAAPLLAGLGSAALLHDAAVYAPGLYLAGSAVLLAATLSILRRQPQLFMATLALAAACWSVGIALWAAGMPLHRVLPWWIAFLVLTIAGERLELARVLPPSPLAQRLFMLILALVLASLLTAPLFATAQDWPARLFGAALVALAAWLLRHDIARRTVHATGLTRFIAVCLLSGYFWLALGGALLASFGLAPGGAAYDAALHALLLGFVFAMVFGHAPIIFPAVLRVAVPYHAWFYAPLAVLHASLALRLAGDALDAFVLLRAGALLSALALLGFIAGTAAAVRRGRKGTQPGR